MTKGRVKLIALLTVLLFSFPQTAYAYIDPGTGSYFLQVILAAVLGISVLLKSYWSKIKSIFNSSSRK